MGDPVGRDVSTPVIDTSTVLRTPINPMQRRTLPVVGFGGCRRPFHATPPPQFIGKLTALGVGFFLRLFYKELSQEHRRLLWSGSYWRHLLSKSPRAVTLSALAVMGASAFVVSSQDTTPVTHRKRYIWTSRKQLVTQSDLVHAAIEANESRHYLHRTSVTYRCGGRAGGQVASGAVRHP